MKILTTFTYEYLKMFKDIFLPSLPENSDVIWQYQNYDLKDCKGKFGAHDSLYKIPFILKVLEECKKNELILYLDVDIVVLSKNIEDEILKLEDKDIHIQWDNPYGGVCLGCVVIKNSEKSRNIFKKFLEADVNWIIQHYGFSLPYFKYLLDNQDISYSQLPLNFYGGQMVQSKIVEPENLMLYHATFERTIEDKYQTLKRYFKRIC